MHKHLHFLPQEETSDCGPFHISAVSGRLPPTTNLGKCIKYVTLAVSFAHDNCHGCNSPLIRSLSPREYPVAKVSPEYEGSSFPPISLPVVTVQLKL